MIADKHNKRPVTALSRGKRIKSGTIPQGVAIPVRDHPQLLLYLMDRGRSRLFLKEPDAFFCQRNVSSRIADCAGDLDG